MTKLEEGITTISYSDLIDMIENNDMIINRMVMVNAFKMHRQPIVFTIQTHPNLKIKQERIKARMEAK